MIRKNESLSNMKDIVDAENPIATTTLNPIESQAIIDSEKFENHIDAVKSELDDKAKDIIVDNPEDTEPDVKNIFTSKLTLKEDLADFNDTTSKPKKVYEQTDEDFFLDYDMYDFIYGLFVSNAEYPPKIPRQLYTGRVNKFLGQGSDSYAIDPTNEEGSGIKGIPQVGTDGDNVVLYSDKKEDFDSVIKVCDLFKLKYKGPDEKSSSYSRWKWSIKIITPTTAPGYPEMLEDYMDTLGLTIEDVMSKDFAKNYRKHQEKENDVKNKELCDSAIRRIVSNYTKNISDTVETKDKINLLNDLYNELDKTEIEFVDGEKHPLIYDKGKVKTLFNKLMKDNIHIA